jgi:transposase-like protein
MQTEYKYFRMPPPASQDWKGFNEERAKAYDLVLTDIIENGEMHSTACRKHGVNPNSFSSVVRYQRRLGLNIPSQNGGFKANKFDPVDGYNYWVVPATHEEQQTKEFGQMFDTLIQQFIDGEGVDILAERYGLPVATIWGNIRRCRKAGSPIPNIGGRAWGKVAKVQDIYEFVNGHNQVKPEVVDEWIRLREVDGCSVKEIAGDYDVSGWTIYRLTIERKKALGEIGS